MGDTTPDLSESNKLIHILPSNATGNVGNAAASNTELLTDDVIEVSDGSTGTTQTFILEDHLDLTDCFRIELGWAIPIPEGTLGFTTLHRIGLPLIRLG